MAKRLTIKTVAPARGGGKEWRYFGKTSRENYQIASACYAPDCREEPTRIDSAAS